MQRIGVLAGLLAVGLLMGCGSIVRTHGAFEDVAGEVAIPYSLPATQLKLGVKVAEKKKKDGTSFVEPQFDVDLTLTPVRVPDPSKRYFLSLDHSGFATDHHLVNVSENGLLTKVNTTSSDQTNAIVAKVGDLAAQAAKLAIKVAAVSAGAPPMGVAAVPKAVEGADPKGDRAKAAQEVADELARQLRSVEKAGGFETTVSFRAAKSGISVRVREAAPGVPGSPALYLNLAVDAVGGLSAADSGAMDLEKGKSHSGIRYRVNATYTSALSLEFGGSPIEGSAPGFFVAPDDSPTYTLPIDRGAFVKVDYKVSLTNGVLTSIETDRPSEVLGFLGLPLTLVEKTLGVLNVIYPSDSGGGAAAKPCCTINVTCGKCDEKKKVK